MSDTTAKLDAIQQTTTDVSSTIGELKTKIEVVESVQHQNKEAVVEIKTAVTGMQKDLKELQDTQHNMTAQLARLETGQGHTWSLLEKLDRAVFQSNGRPSLLERVTSVEVAQESMLKDQDAMSEHLNAAQAARAAGRWQFWGTVVGTICTAIAVAGTIFSQMWK